MRKIFWVALPTLLVLGLIRSLGGNALAGTTYAEGDVFGSVGEGKVNEYTPTGTLVQTLDTTTGSFNTAGGAFDSSNNFYVTGFQAGSITKFDNAGNVVLPNFASGQTNPESIVFNQAGNLYVGDADAHPKAGFGLVQEYSSTGTLLNSFSNLAIQDRGTDWIDLAANQHTLLYTSEGTSILSYDLTTGTQNADFADHLPGRTAYALRIIPGGTFAGDVLVADSSAALLVSTSGSILHTYALPGNVGNDFALNLDPNGTSFWTADLSSGNVWKVNIASGTIEQQWNAHPFTDIAGLTVLGQITAGTGGGGGVTTPEPASLVLLGSGLAGLAGWQWRRMKQMKQE